MVRHVLKQRAPELADRLLWHASQLDAVALDNEAGQADQEPAMRVLFVQRQPCIRALKYAVGLRSAAPGVHLGFACEGATLSQFYGEGDELFERWFHLDGDPRGDLERALDVFRPDVIHSHNLPDHLTVLASEVSAGRVPIVHDVNDLRSLRVTPYEDGLPESDEDHLDLERRAIEGSDALITVSDELLGEIEARHRAPGLRAVFPNLALRRDLPRDAAAVGVEALLVAALVAVAFIDADHRIIPDAITKPGIVVGLLASLVFALLFKVL